MLELPAGTVTYLFTDIEGSTRLWEDHPADATRMLARHDELIESEVARHAGIVVRPRGEGDSRFCVFARATDAVAATLAILLAFVKEPWSVPLNVRMAVHTGEAEVRDGDYYGSAVNRCARIRAVAHGGQALVSSTTEELVRDSLPAGTSLRDLGDHRLRDLSAPVSLFQLVHPDLRDVFPALRSLATVSNNLPVQLTSFVGRGAEVIEVRKLLEESRLVTLTGAGGCGKTRLALQAAAEMLDGFADGAWFVDLAPVTDPALVPQAIARALGLQEEHGKPLLETVIDSLRARHLLMVLDNCEHLLTASARAATEILLACPDVRLFATGREALGVGGETPWRVPSLSQPINSDGLDSLATSEAARLFVERARSASSSVAFTDDDAPAIAQICARLDGIPLAIELAAARAGVLAPDQIAARMGDHFLLLTGGSRTALERHQTLRAAVDWSHALLSEPEKVLLRRLSVFSGGFTLEACEEVCSDRGIARADALDLLGALVDKSLVDVERVGRAARYRFLETMRQYAREKLSESADGPDARARHLAWCAALACEAAPELHGPRQVEWFHRLAEEHDNIRAALEWAIGSGDTEAALTLASDINFFWNVRGHWTEASDRLNAALALPGGSERARAWVLVWAAEFALLQDDYDAADAFLVQARALAEATGDPRLLGWTFLRLGVQAVVRRNRDEAFAFFDRSMEIAEDVLDRPLVSRILANRAVGHQDQAEAQRWLEQSLAVAREIGNINSIGFGLANLGGIAINRSEYARARGILREALEYLRPVGHKRMIAQAVGALAVADFFQTDYDAARPLFEEAAALARELGGTTAEATTLFNQGTCAFMDEDYATACDRWTRLSDLNERYGEKEGQALYAFIAGSAAHAEGASDTTRRLYERSIAVFRTVPEAHQVALPLVCLARLEAVEGNFDRSHGLTLDALQTFRSRGTPMDRTHCIESVAYVDAVSDRSERAARLFGAAQASRERIELPIWPAWRTWYDEGVARARAACGDAVFEAAWAQGRALSLDEAFAHALEDA